MSRNSSQKRRLKEARRKTRMKRKLARRGAEQHKAKSTHDMKGKNMSHEKSDEQVDAMVKLHRMLNNLAITKVGDGFINATTSAMRKQMEDGYRLAFPAFMGHGELLRCVALLARANDSCRVSEYLPRVLSV